MVVVRVCWWMAWHTRRKKSTTFIEFFFFLVYIEFVVFVKGKTGNEFLSNFCRRKTLLKVNRSESVREETVFRSDWGFRTQVSRRKKITDAFSHEKFQKKVVCGELRVTQERSFFSRERRKNAVMTSLSCGVDALLRAAEFLEKQETTSGQLYRPVVAESPMISTGKDFFSFFFWCMKILREKRE